MLKNGLVISFFFTIVFHFLYLLPLYTQVKSNYFVEIKYQNGYIVEHTEAVEKLVKENIKIAEFNFIFPIDGNKGWGHLYNLPELGLGYSFKKVSGIKGIINL